MQKMHKLPKCTKNIQIFNVKRSTILSFRIAVDVGAACIDMVANKGNKIKHYIEVPDGRHSVERIRANYDIVSPARRKMSDGGQEPDV